MFFTEDFKPSDLLNDSEHASHQQEVIINHIKEFQDTLDSEHEVGLFLTNFGIQKTMIVTDIGFANPVLIIFYGYVDGVDSELIQHISQINFLLTAVAKPDQSKPARRIGFIASNDEDKD